jgi:hypothetical protein
MDIDGDGKPNEINMGCETCHGPGSAHEKSKESFSSIVSPNKLAAERASMICVQCHSRPQGNLKNDQPVNTANKMMLPGTSRKARTSSSRPSTATATSWWRVPTVTICTATASFRIR